MKTEELKPKPFRLDITDRDLQILRFLWKWKMVSTSAIALKFFPNAVVQTGYKRLMLLARAEYILFVQTNHYTGQGWTLTPKGYKVIRHLLGDLKVDGYKSEYQHHDRLVTALHLGDWLTFQPEYTQTFTEQQLRRIPIDLWDDWVPKSAVHRPDGYSLLFHGDNKLLIAFEVELSLKSKNRYESLVAFYDVQRSVDVVIWLVNSRVTLNSMKRTFEQLNVREMQKHNFLLLSDFEKRGWRARFVSGKFIGKTPADLLLHLPHPRIAPEPDRRGVLALLKNSKKLIDKTSYEISKKR